MGKVSKNLSLDETAVGRGERYSALHHTNLSRLVSDFLARLPIDEPTRQLAPTVGRLLGIASHGHDTSAAPDAYQEHLWTKYGRA